MRRILVAAVAAVVILTAGSSFGFSAKGQDCSKCHALKKDEAANILKEIIPSVKIGGIRISPVKSLWEVDVESNGKKGIIYIDFSKRFAFSGSLIDVKEKKNVTQDRYEDINRVDASKIPVKDALLLGSPAAKKKVIVFTDPDCPFCAKLHTELKKVVAERKDIAFLIKMFPLPIHKDAFDKAKAIVCEKSLRMLEDAFEKKTIPKPKCKTDIVDQNIELAKKHGFNGTPVLIMPNGRVVAGYRDAAAIKEMVDRK